MLKKSIISVAALAALAGTVAPAFAHDSLFGDGTFEDRAQVRQFVVHELRAKGVNATSVDEWGGYIRAYVVAPDGRQVQRFFVPHTLEPARISG